MVENDTQVCNIALRRINAEPISDLVDDDGKSAVLCRTLYEPSRDACLRAHPWAFSIKRQVLAVSTDDNLSPFIFLYTLPSDPYCLKPIVLLDTLDLYIEVPEYPFQVEGRGLLTDLPSAGLKYISRVTDASLFDDSFVNALAWRLAAELIKPVEGNSPVDPWVMYRDAIVSAIADNDQGSQSPYVPPISWADGRF
jgi:hypothetical protein